MQCSFHILIPKYPMQRSFGYKKQKTSLGSLVKGGLRHRTDETSVIPSFLLSYVSLLVYSILLSVDQHHSLPASWFLHLHNFTLHWLSSTSGLGPQGEPRPW